MIEITDRYTAVGLPYPDPKTVCKGRCEGMGCWPCRDKENPQWKEDHAKPHTEACDGWHFVTCLDCGGSGKIRQESKL